MAYYDFAEIKRRVSITQAAEMLQLPLKQERAQFRSSCPGCNNADPRILVITPDKGMFYCFDAKKGGDCIALVQHITGLDLEGAAEHLAEVSNMPSGSSTTVRTAPQKPEARNQPSSTKKPPAPFDPQAFAAKLVYSAEVEELGFSEEDAEKLGVGFHPQRKKVYFPLRNIDGTIAGFTGFSDGQLHMPPRWIFSTVVPFKQRA